jgi:hypothetical protein
MGKNGTATAHYRVETAIIGDRYCGTAGHPTCVIGVGTANGSGTVVQDHVPQPAAVPGVHPGRPVRTVDPHHLA